MARLSAIRTDITKVEDGVWEDYLDGMSLCIASTENKAYKRARDKLMRPHLRRVRSKDFSNEEVLEIIKPAVAHHILRDWKNIEDDDGKPIPFTPETALEWFNDPALGDLYSFVLEVAGEAGVYRQTLLEEAVGN